MLHAHFCTHGHILLARAFPPVTHLTSQTKMNLGLNPWWAHFIADPRSRLSKGCGEKFQNESFFEGSPARYVLAMDKRCACRVNTRGKNSTEVQYPNQSHQCTAFFANSSNLPTKQRLSFWPLQIFDRRAFLHNRVVPSVLWFLPGTHAHTQSGRLCLI